MPRMIPPRRWFGPAAFALCSGSLLVAGCGPGGSTSPASTAKYQNTAVSTGSSAPAAPPTAVPNSFDEVAARLDRGGSFYLYWSLAQYLDDLSGKVAKLRATFPTEGMSPKDQQQVDTLYKLGTDLVKNSGIEQITGLGGSSLAIEPNVTRNTVFVHHDKGKMTGLLNTLFGTATHPLTALNLLPAETAVASSGDYDLTALAHAILQTIDESGQPELKQKTADNLQQFQALTGMTLDEFLASLGQEIDLVLTLDPAKTITVPMGKEGGTMSIPLPRLALLIEVKDDKLFDKVDQTLGVVPSIIKTDEPGLKTRTFAYPLMPDYELRATVARWDKYLVLATDDHLVRDMTAAQKGGAGFKASPLFAKLSPGLPGEGNGFTLQTRAFTQLVLDYQRQAVAAQKGATPAQYEWLQKLMLSQGAADQFSVSGHVENGWLKVSKVAR